MPLGGKNALLNIQKDGGFLSFDDMAWVKPVEEPVAVHKLSLIHIWRAATAQ